MTVHELIKHLQVLPQDKKVMLRHDDHRLDLQSGINTRLN